MGIIETKDRTLQSEKDENKLRIDHRGIFFCILRETIDEKELEEIYFDWNIHFKEIDNLILCVVETKTHQYESFFHTSVFQFTIDDLEELNKRDIFFFTVIYADRKTGECKAFKYVRLIELARSFLIRRLIDQLSKRKKADECLQAYEEIQKSNTIEYLIKTADVKQ